MRRTVIVLLLGLSCAAMVSGCGDDAARDPAGSPSASPPADDQPEDPLTDPPLTGKPGKQGGTVTVVGVVSDGVEANCLVLDTGTETLQLLGVRPGDLPATGRVVVTGVRQPDLVTTCQQGTPFRVSAIRAE